MLGGEGTYWTEYIDSSGIVSRTFPRMSAIAERLWSKNEGFTSVGLRPFDTDDAFPRLNKFRCLMVKRGIAAEPLSVPSSCDEEFDFGYRPAYDNEESGNSGNSIDRGFALINLAIFILFVSKII